MRPWLVAVCSLCVCSVTGFAGEPLSGVSVSDAPDPFSPPVAQQNTITGTFRFSPSGPNVDNPAITQRHLLRMTVAISKNGSGPQVRILSGEISAAQVPGDPNVVERSVSVTWNGLDRAGQAVPDGMYRYTAVGSIVKFHQNKKGKDQEPHETVMETSPELTGTIFVDSKAPAIALTPPNGSFTGNANQVISAAFDDGAPSSGVAAASGTFVLDGADRSAEAIFSATGMSFTPPAPLAEGTHTFTVTISDKAGNTASATGAFTVDLTGPEISSVQPADGAQIATAQPEIAVEFADALSGADPSSASLRIDGSPVSAQVTASRLTHTPASPLAEGNHDLEFAIRDSVGNESARNWSFFVDTVAPRVLATSVLPKAVTNNPRPSLAASWEDPAPGTGVHADGVRIFLDGQDVTAQAEISESGFTFTPAEDLPEGAHQLSGILPDAVGNQGSFGISFETDYSPPGAPVITAVDRTENRVTVSGDTEPDVVEVIATANGANVESAVIASFVVVFGKTTNTNFSFTLQLRDEAGNLSAITTGNESFLDEGGPPVSIGEFLIEPPQGKKFIPDGERFLTDSDALSVKVSVEGGTPPFDVFVGGTNATPLGGVGNLFEAQLSGLPDGEQEIVVSVSDSEGQAATASKTVVVDTTLPTVEISTIRRTAPLSFLLLNDPARNPVINTANDSLLPRVTFDRQSYAPEGTAQDEGAGLQKIRALVFETTAIFNDTKYPLPDYDAQKAAQLEQILAQAHVREIDLLDLPSGQTDPMDFIATQVARDLDQKTYLLAIEAQDVVSNTAHALVWFRVDYTPPSATGTGSHLGFSDAPLAGVSGDSSVVQVFQSGSNLRKGWVSGPWLLNTIPEATDSSGSTVSVEFADLAGNKITSTISLGHRPEALGQLEETTFYERIEWEGSEDDKLILSIFEELNEYNEEIKDADISGIGLRFSGNGFVLVTPSWDTSRQHAIESQVDGSKTRENLDGPQLAETQAFVSEEEENRSPDAETEVTSISTRSVSLLPGPPLALNAENIEIAPEDPSFTPGLHGLAMSYSSFWSTNTLLRRPGEPAGPFSDGTTVDESWSAESRSQVSGLVKPEAFTVFKVEPDVLVAGQRQTVRILGYFGAGLRDGDTVSVSISPAAGAEGSVDVFNESAVIRLVDPTNATVFHVLELDLKPSEDSIGKFTVSGSGATLIEALNVLRIEFVPIDIHNAALEDEKTPYLQMARPRPKARFTHPLEGTLVLEPTALASLNIKGEIEDPIATASEGALAPKATVSGVEIELTPNRSNGILKYTFDEEIFIGGGQSNYVLNVENVLEQANTDALVIERGFAFQQSQLPVSPDQFPLSSENAIFSPFIITVSFQNALSLDYVIRDSVSNQVTLTGTAAKQDAVNYSDAQNGVALRFWEENEPTDETQVDSLGVTITLAEAFGGGNFHKILTETGLNTTTFGDSNIYVKINLSQQLPIELSLGLYRLFKSFSQHNLVKVGEGVYSDEDIRVSFITDLDGQQKDLHVVQVERLDGSSEPTILVISLSDDLEYESNHIVQIQQSEGGSNPDNNTVTNTPDIDPMGNAKGIIRITDMTNFIEGLDTLKMTYFSQDPRDLSQIAIKVESRDTFTLETTPFIAAMYFDDFAGKRQFQQGLEQYGILQVRPTGLIKISLNGVELPFGIWPTLDKDD